MPILMVDDNEHTIYKLRERLARYAEINYVSTLDDAIYALKENDYDIITTDFHMDHLDGKQLLKLLKGEFNDSYHFKDNIENTTLKEIYEHDPEISEVIDVYFDDIEEYKDFVKKYEDTVFVLFSATKYGDGDDEPILQDVFVAQKHNKDSTNYDSENSVRDYLLEIGAISNEDYVPTDKYVLDYIEEANGKVKEMRKKEKQREKEKIKGQ